MCKHVCFHPVSSSLPHNAWRLWRSLRRPLVRPWLVSCWDSCLIMCCRACSQCHKVKKESVNKLKRIKDREQTTPGLSKVNLLARGRNLLLCDSFPNCFEMNFGMKRLGSFEVKTCWCGPVECFESFAPMNDLSSLRWLDDVTIYRYTPWSISIRYLVSTSGRTLKHEISNSLKYKSN